MHVLLVLVGDLHVLLELLSIARDLHQDERLVDQAAMGCTLTTYTPADGKGSRLSRLHIVQWTMASTLTLQPCQALISSPLHDLQTGGHSCRLSTEET